MTFSKKMSIVTIALSLGMSMPHTVMAGTFRDNGRGDDDKKEVRQEEKKDFFRGLKDKTENVVRKFVNTAKAAIVGGTITAKTDTTLTVEKDGKSYTVNLTDKTQLRRKFWGKSTTSEFAVGNTVNVYGAWTDDTQTTMNARMIRNISIQKRFGVFFGEVKSLLSGGWVMTTVSGKRQDQTVTVSSSTKIENKKGETMTQADVQVGHRVRVKGLWDSSNNTVTEVTHVKDFSLPVVTATATPTPTPTP
jgi:hypothetical protein